MCLADNGVFRFEQPGGSNLLTNWSIRAKNSSIAVPQDTASRSLKKRSVRSPSSIDSGYESLGTASGDSSPTSDRSADESTEPHSQTAIQTRIFKDASRAFFGQINNHSQAAKEKMRCLRVARLSTSNGHDDEDDG